MSKSTKSANLTQVPSSLTPAQKRAATIAAKKAAQLENQQPVQIQTLEEYVDSDNTERTPDYDSRDQEVMREDKVDAVVSEIVADAYSDKIAVMRETSSPVTLDETGDEVGSVSWAVDQANQISGRTDAIAWASHADLAGKAFPSLRFCVGYPVDELALKAGQTKAWIAIPGGFLRYDHKAAILGSGKNYLAAVKDAKSRQLAIAA